MSRREPPPKAIPNALLTLAPRTTRLWRIIEHQEQAATRAITDSLEAQSRLETLLETNKPDWLPGSEGVHWLLRTPFRYPPLRHGSRFGTAREPGVLYGSERPETALIETATYLWLFRDAPVTTGPLAVLRGGRTGLRFSVRAERCADLARSTLARHHRRLRNPKSWVDTQHLGTALRKRDADLIRYRSARDPDGLNGAVINPQCVAGNRRPHQEHWAFRLDDQRCWWGRGRQQFEVQYGDLADSSGRIPHPAL